MTIEEETFFSGMNKRVKTFFKDSENRKNFEDWYLKRYGKPYRTKEKEHVS